MPSRCSSVDLPAPDGPMTEMKSPSRISRLMRRRTKVLVGPCSKYFSTLRSWIIRQNTGILEFWNERGGLKPTPPSGALMQPRDGVLRDIAEVTALDAFDRILNMNRGAAHASKQARIRSLGERQERQHDHQQRDRIDV